MGRVIGVMQRLRDAGNSLVVVEHDPQIMLQADRILDMGPGPAERGGEIVFFGTPDELKQSKTLTAEYLSGENAPMTKRGQTRFSGKPWSVPFELLGAAEHNLKTSMSAFRSSGWCCITGVSGSGKSTLVQDVLYAALRKAKGKPTEVPGTFRDCAARLIEDAVMVNQAPIGRTTRSNPASYVGALGRDPQYLRKRAARERAQVHRRHLQLQFRQRPLPTCGGNGFEHVEMQFLSDVYLRCPDCNGRRFRDEVLEVVVDGKSIADVLELTYPRRSRSPGPCGVQRALKPLADVGLEYLRIGQPVPTLSGGEAQRLKLAGHTGRGSSKPKGARGSLFLFDEPTTGLHFDDVAKLLSAFRQLIDAGHSLA